MTRSYRLIVNTTRPYANLRVSLFIGAWGRFLLEFGLNQRNQAPFYIRKYDIIAVPPFLHFLNFDIVQASQTQFLGVSSKEMHSRLPYKR